MITRYNSKKQQLFLEGRTLDPWNLCLTAHGSLLFIEVAQRGREADMQGTWPLMSGCSISGLKPNQASGVSAFLLHSAHQSNSYGKLWWPTLCYLRAGAASPDWAQLLLPVLPGPHGWRLKIPSDPSCFSWRSSWHFLKSDLEILFWEYFHLIPSWRIFLQEVSF
jgi:hypothetical protein